MVDFWTLRHPGEMTEGIFYKLFFGVETVEMDQNAVIVIGISIIDIWYFFNMTKT